MLAYPTANAGVASITQCLARELAPEGITVNAIVPSMIDTPANRKARPDEWEERVIETKLNSPEWPRGQFYGESFQSKGRDAFRVAVPEYYSASCLSCHGEPKGEIDITGYPKEGAEEGDLGGVISITLFHTEE